MIKDSKDKRINGRQINQLVSNISKKFSPIKSYNDAKTRQKVDLGSGEDVYRIRKKSKLTSSQQNLRFLEYKRPI